MLESLESTLVKVEVGGEWKVGVVIFLYITNGCDLKEGGVGEQFWKCLKVKNQKCFCDGMWVRMKVWVKWSKSQKPLKLRYVGPLL